MAPLENISKWLVKERYPRNLPFTPDTDSASQPTSQNISNAENPATAATIWLFVSELANIPSAINDVPIRNNPAYPAATLPRSICP